MALIPFTLILQAVLTNGGTATVSYPVPPGETLLIKDMVFASTGAFNIYGIRDSSGRNYTNASLSVEIPSTVLASGANNNNHIPPFDIPLIVEGSTTIYFDLEDTSGAGNTVDLVFTCHRNTNA